MNLLNEWPWNVGAVLFLAFILGELAAIYALMTLTTKGEEDDRDIWEVSEGMRPRYIRRESIGLIVQIIAWAVIIGVFVTFAFIFQNL